MVPLKSVSVAVLIPCLNEEKSIYRVVSDFRSALPGALVYVYDNNSSDRTSEQAADAGAIVRYVPLQGKGHVVHRMFSDIEADVYLMVDGDGTYDIASAPRMVELLIVKHLDMVNGARQPVEDGTYRPGHRLGNLFLTGLVSAIFGRRFNDMLSGYKAFSRRFVKSFPALTDSFEIETELTIHALELDMPVAEVTTPYSKRAKGSDSKLNTYRDGLRILRAIIWFVQKERPLHFFLMMAFFFFLTAMAAGVPVITEFWETGLVQRFPTAILASGLMILSFLSLVCGLILDTVTLGRKEMKRMFYLNSGSPNALKKDFVSK